MAEQSASGSVAEFQNNEQWLDFAAASDRSVWGLFCLLAA
jgi:hypothetical protein